MSLTSYTLAKISIVYNSPFILDPSTPGRRREPPSVRMTTSTSLATTSSTPPVSSTRCRRGCAASPATSTRCCCASAKCSSQRCTRSHGPPSGAILRSAYSTCTNSSIGRQRRGWQYRNRIKHQCFVYNCNILRERLITNTKIIEKSKNYYKCRLCVWKCIMNSTPCTIVRTSHYDLRLRHTGRNALVR